MKKAIVLFIFFLILLVVGLFFGLREKKFEFTNTQEENMFVQNETDEFSESLEENSQNPEVFIISKEEDKKIMQATINTNMGDITIEFLPDLAPKTVENFIKLTKEGFYNETKFHRVIKDFMNQGGDPLSKDDTRIDFWGTGGPGYQFEDEITQNNKNDAYTISMANAGPNTNGSQFFINVSDNNFLDTKHTVFGKVISGKEVVDSINNVATLPNDRPIEPVIINKIILK